LGGGEEEEEEEEEEVEEEAEAAAREGVQQMGWYVLRPSCEYRLRPQPHRIPSESNTRV